MEETVSISFAL